MEFTEKEFWKQNANWEDANYCYAIHITDGGAIYLHQIMKDPRQEWNDLQENIIRLDGINWEIFDGEMRKLRKNEVV